MILIFVLFFNALEALYEGLYDSGHKLFSGIVEFIQKIGIVLALAFLATNNLATDLQIWELALGFALVRYCIFNPIYNLTRGLNIFYIGNTKIFDKILSRLPLMLVVATQMIAGFVGVFLLL